MAVSYRTFRIPLDFRTPLRLKLALDSGDLRHFKSVFQEINQLFKKETPALTLVAARAMGRVLAARIESTKVPPLELYPAGDAHSKTQVAEAMTAFEKLALAEPTYLGSGWAGLMPRTEMDRYRQKRLHRSPYNIWWMMIEYGTGRYAVEGMKRSQGRHKVTDKFWGIQGGEWWVTGKRHRKPLEKLGEDDKRELVPRDLIAIGQRPTYMLFGKSATDPHNLAMRAAAIHAVSEYIRNMFLK